MAKQPIKKQQPAPKPPIKQKLTAKTTAESTKSIFEYLEGHFSTKRNFYLILLVVLSAFFSFLCFDNKISTANDDALYIESGASYAKDFFGYFYLANAPLYPIILGMIIKLIGVKLTFLKLFSLLFFSSSVYFLFIAFEKRIPYIILVPALLLTAVNAQFLMYASLTYTEAFSLMIFGISFFILFKIFDKLDTETYAFKNNIPLFILIGFLFFLMMITRSVALGAIGVLAVYFMYRKKYIETIASVIFFAVFYILYKISLTYIWNVDGSQFAVQTKLMFQKDVYNPQLGNEDTWGFVVRFWQNCQIYISSRLFYVLGFKGESSPVNIPLTLFSIGLVIWSILLMHLRKQYTLLFSSLFFVALLVVTFITLNVSWGQTRLIMIFLPFILFSIFYIFYYYGSQFSILQPLYLFVFFILFFVNMSATLKQAKARFPIFLENISGDATFGYTPDWQNYIKMTKWCAQNFPNDTKSIAVRKAPMSFIFSDGKEFYPIYGTPTENPDSLLIPLRASKVNYLMTAELRANPEMYVDGQIIGTMHRYAYYIQQKYPQAFQFVHQEGDVEEAVLYKINYKYIDSLKSSTK